MKEVNIFITILLIILVIALIFYFMAIAQVFDAEAAELDCCPGRCSRVLLPLVSKAACYTIQDTSCGSTIDSP